MDTCVEDRERSRKCTQLLVAAKEGNIPTLIELIDNHANVNTDSFFFGHTPLMEAASAGQIEAAKILFERGANIHAHSKFDQSALMLAHKNNHVEMVSFLLQAGANERELQKCLDLRSPIVNQSQQQGTSNAASPTNTAVSQSGMGMAELQQRIQQLQQHNDELLAKNKNLIERNNQLVQLIQQMQVHFNQMN